MDVDEYMKILDEQFDNDNFRSNSMLTVEEIEKMKENCRRIFIENNISLQSLPVEDPIAQAIEDEELINL